MFSDYCVHFSGSCVSGSTSGTPYSTHTHTHTHTQHAAFGSNPAVMHHNPGYLQQRGCGLHWRKGSGKVKIAKVGEAARIQGELEE